MKLFHERDTHHYEGPPSWADKAVLIVVTVGFAVAMFFDVIRL